MPKPRKAAKPPKATALDRLRRHAPDGPPFLGIMLDEASMRCLALGVVNARCEVAAQQCIAQFDKFTLVIDK